MNNKEISEKDAKELASAFGKLLVDIKRHEFYQGLVKIGMEHFAEDDITYHQKVLYKYLMYEDYLDLENLEDSDKITFKNCFSSMVKNYELLNCYILVSHYGVNPISSDGFDYYDMIKRYQFILLCLKRWKKLGYLEGDALNIQEAILSYYLGGAAKGLSIYDKIIIPHNVVLDARQLYYYCLMSKIVDEDFEKRSENAISTILEEDEESQYYKGLIYLLKEKPLDALDCFLLSSGYTYSKTLLNQDIKAIPFPKVKEISFTSDNYSVFDEYMHFHECMLALHGSNYKPAFCKFFKGDLESLEDCIKLEKANELSKYLYKDLYNRTVELSEEEYKARLSFFDSKLADSTDEVRSAFLSIQGGLQYVPDRVEHQIAMTIEAFKLNNFFYYAFLIYNYYFRKMLTQEEVIDLSFYVMHIAKEKFGDKILEIASQTTLSVLALRIIWPCYDVSTPIRQFILATPITIAKVSKKKE